MFKFLLLFIAQQSFSLSALESSKLSTCQFDQRVLVIGEVTNKTLLRNLNRLCDLEKSDTSHVRIDEWASSSEIELKKDEIVLLHFMKTNMSKAFEVPTIVDAKVKRMVEISGLNNYLLGDAYLFGMNKKVNYELAKNLYENIDDKYKFLAYERLAMIYLEGLGVDENLEIASKFLYESIAQTGELDYFFSMASDLILNRQFNKSNLILSVLSKFKHAPSIHNLGVSYANGYGVNRNLTTAINFLKRSAEMDYTDSQKSLGKIYFQAKQYEEAAKWMKIAAGKNDVIAMFAYGDMLLRKSVSIGKDYINAKRYLEGAFKMGHMPAAFNLALFHRLLFKKYKEIQYYDLAVDYLLQLERSQYGINEILKERKKLELVKLQNNK